MTLETKGGQGDPRGDEREKKPLKNQLSEEQFFEILRKTVSADLLKSHPAPQNQPRWGTREVAAEFGQYGNWRSYEHPDKDGWLLVEMLNKDQLKGDRMFYFETNNRDSFSRDMDCERREWKDLKYAWGIGLAVESPTKAHFFRYSLFVVDSVKLLEYTRGI